MSKSPEERIASLDKTAKIIGWIIVVLLIITIVAALLMFTGSLAFVIMGSLLMGIMVFVGVPLMVILLIAYGVTKNQSCSLKTKLISTSVAPAAATPAVAPPAATPAVSP